MRHPTDGVLRRLVDEPAGVADVDRRHVAACERCLVALSAVRRDATLVGAALDPGAHADADVAAAWRRLSAAPAKPGRAAAPPPRARAVLRKPAVAAIALAVVLTGAGTAAASGWLQIFRTEQVAPVSFSTADLLALPDLQAYGDVVITREGDLHRVPDAATATAETGVPVPHPTALPRGVKGAPTYQAGGKVSAAFTFSSERAAEAAAKAGHALPPPPPGLDGSTVRLVAGPGVAVTWAQPGGMPTLLVARAVAPAAFSSGVPFETVRDYVLSLPGLPERVATQLRTFTADGSTLPLPVPADRVTTTSAEVHGSRATVLTTRDRALAAVVWVDAGMLTVVAGSLDAGEVLAIARGLR